MSEPVSLSDGTSLQHMLLACGTPDSIDSLVPETSFPDVPWYVLQLSPCLPSPYPTALPAAPGTWPCSLTGNCNGAPLVPAPYAPSGRQPGPDYPGQIIDNVVRYWDHDPTFVIHANGPVGTLGSPVGSVVHTWTNGNYYPPATYTWDNFVHEIELTLLKMVNTLTSGYSGTNAVLSGNPYCDIRATTVVAPSSGYYAIHDSVTNLNTGSCPGSFIWTTQPDLLGNYGPTGNGVNDIALHANAVGTGTFSGGFASVLFDPSNGRIIEADVLFELLFFTQSFPSSLPRESTAFFHELAHAFGLDHTNLHAGSGTIPMSSSGSNPLPLAGFAASTTSFTGFVDFQSPLPWTVVPTEYPQTIGGILKLPGVLRPTPTSSYSIVVGQGHNFVNDPIHPDDRAGLARIYPVTRVSSGKRPLINDSAIIEGHVYGPTGAALPHMNVLALERLFSSGTPALVPRNGAVSGMARLSSGDVTGVTQGAFQGSQPGTGGYRIVGVFPPNPQNYQPSGIPADMVDLLVEDFGHHGISLSGGGAHFGEWFYETLLNPSLNTITQAPTQFLLLSNTSSLQGAAGSDVVGSLTIVPGAVITANIRVSGSGAALEAASRPVVQITPRSMPAPGTSMTITIDHNYKRSSVTMTVNGADFDLIPYPPSHPTNQRTVYSIPDSAITPPATIQVTATELVTGPVAGVPGVNRVVY